MLRATTIAELARATATRPADWHTSPSRTVYLTRDGEVFHDSKGRGVYVAPRDVHKAVARLYRLLASSSELEAEHKPRALRLRKVR